MKISKTAPNRLDIEFDGKIDAQAMEAALDDLQRLSEGIEHGRILYRIGAFDFPTMGAIGVELSRLASLFRLIRRFDKAAVLADQQWLKTVSEIEGALVPGLEIKAFDRDQLAAAEAWLDE